MTKDILRRAGLHYVIYLGFFWLLLAIYIEHPYFAGFLRSETSFTLTLLWLGYATLGLPGYLWLFWRAGQPGAQAMTTKLEQIWHWWRTLPGSSESVAVARTAALSFVVKFFFLPLMLNFFFGHIEALTQLWHGKEWSSFSGWAWFWQVGYHLIFNSIFLIDTFVFSAAYMIESRYLGNVIKSVDPYPSGWIVALICYAPFAATANQIIPLTRDTAWLTTGWLLDASKIGILLLFGIYLWATLALGWRAGNLVNRGIVASGPYRFLRHPAYTAKNLAWWLEFLPYLNFGLAASLLAWNAIYVLRGLTEERHLSADPDYRQYCQKVKWRFVPGLW